MDNTVVTPGQRLGYAGDYIAGSGIYERDGLLYASVVGVRSVKEDSNGNVSQVEADRVPWHSFTSCFAVTDYDSIT